MFSEMNIERDDNMRYDINRGELDEILEPTHEEKRLRELEMEMAKMRRTIDAVIELGNSDYTCSSSDIVSTMVNMLEKTRIE